MQNGEFSNMAEFPVLQMLYKQGMIIPNHPNNTGIKPLLIGTNRMLNSQLKYIYRGNYGLISEEEIQAVGYSAEEAHDIMRMKLAFAFGKMWKTEELLDAKILYNEPVEIRNGVYLQREGFNRYRFSYQGESILVNLNLDKGEGYECPYPLNFQTIHRDEFSVIHSGEGDGWDPNRPCMASILIYAGKVYLIDAGPHLHQTLLALGIDASEIEGVFITHSHDDHFAGLPGLLRSDHRIKYYSTPLVRASISKKLAALMSFDESKFEQYFEVHDMEFDTWNDVDALEVKPIFSPHPVETQIFIFRNTFGMYFTYGHFADITSISILQKMVTEDSQKTGITPALLEKMKAIYNMPLDLKKIDIGGAPIHGVAQDFQEDPSKEIILSHTEFQLSREQKSIGTGVAFGEHHTFFSRARNLFREQALDYLRAYFPQTNPSEFYSIVESPHITIPPGRTIVEAGIVNYHVYLLLTGTVECESPQFVSKKRIPNGYLVGEISALWENLPKHSYQTKSAVQAIKIPVETYRQFLKNSGLYEETLKEHPDLEFLQNNWFFGDGVSYPVQKQLLKEMTLHSYQQGDLLKVDGIYVVQTGSIELSCEGHLIEVVYAGNCLGEGSILFKIPNFFAAKAIVNTKAYRIQTNRLLNIPIVHWKLLELFEKRLQILIKSISQQDIAKIMALPTKVDDTQFANNSLKVSYQIHAETLLVRCNGMLIASHLKQLWQQIQQRLQQNSLRFLVINCAEVTLIDASGIYFFLIYYYFLKESLGKITLCHLNPFLQSIIKISGIEWMISIFSQESEALRYCHNCTKSRPVIK